MHWVVRCVQAMCVGWNSTQYAAPKLSKVKLLFCWLSLLHAAVRLMLCVILQIEPRYHNWEGASGASLDPFRGATRIPFLASGGELKALRFSG